MTVTAKERESLERAKRIRDRLAEADLESFPDRYEAVTISPVDSPKVPNEHFEVRFRYFPAGRGERGPRFCWTTQRADGDFESFVWKDDDSMRQRRRHAKRKDAKARAMKLYEQHTGEAP